MKDLKVSDELHKKFMKMKYEYGYKNVEEIVERLLKIVPASELKIKGDENENK